MADPQHLSAVYYAKQQTQDAMRHAWDYTHQQHRAARERAEWLAKLYQGVESLNRALMFLRQDNALEVRPPDPEGLRAYADDVYSMAMRLYAMLPSQLLRASTDPSATYKGPGEGVLNEDDELALVPFLVAVLREARAYGASADPDHDLWLRAKAVTQAAIAELDAWGNAQFASQVAPRPRDGNATRPVGDN